MSPEPTAARFSPDRRHRYTLTRNITDGPRKTCLFVMLNPSTADEHKLDPTCTRCFNFARDWGFTVLEVCNVYAFRSTDPRGLWTVDDPVGPDNLHWIGRKAFRADLVVCAWGVHARPYDVARTLATIRGEGAETTCLKLTASGAPGHPLTFGPI